MSVFGENDSRHLYHFSQSHSFWKLVHISRTYNQINYSNIWFAKVTIILIMMAQVLFSILDPHFNAVENIPDQLFTIRTKHWVEINDEWRRKYNTKSQIKFKTPMLQFSLCDYNDTNIHVKEIITITNTTAAGEDANNNNK